MSRIKALLIIFFDSQGVVHKELAPEGKTVNAEFYKGVMDRLLKDIKWIRPAVFCSRDCFLLHDNAPAHKAASLCQFLTLKILQTLSSPCCPDLSPWDYFLFPNLKMKLKGLHLTGVADMQDAVTDKLKMLKKIFSSFSENVRHRKSLYICQWSLF